MSRAEALAEARRRWGVLGWVRPPKKPNGTAYTVGFKATRHGVHWSERDRSMVEARSGTPIVKGRGPSWEAAFLEAARRSSEGG